MKHHKQAPKSQDGLQAGDSPVLELDSISQEGQGIGHHDGLTVFIEGGLPGDRVLARINRRMSHYAVGSIQKIIQPSPLRVQPACVQAKACGGCTLQTLAYPAQLAVKQQQVTDALQRIGHLDAAASLIRPIIGMSDPWHYRAKVQLPVTGAADRPQIGFYAAGSHQVVDAQSCLIQHPICDAIREALREHIKTWQIPPYQEQTHSGLLRHLVIRLGLATGDVMVGLVLNGDSLPGQDEWVEHLKSVIAGFHGATSFQLTCFYLNINRERTNVIQTSDIRMIYGQGWIEEHILGLRYRISPLAFFQVNPLQTERLYAAVLELAALTGSETALDLYCGTGSITLQLARRAANVLGIEMIGEAIADARRNAELNAINNAKFLTGKAEDLLPGLVADGLKADLVVVDPPRKGCDGSLINTLIQLAAPRIIYVSCNPATLARDVALLQPAGYRVQAVQPVDMFPWSGHVETCVLITRVDK
ncbi:MAG: 23S rRNA (uracil(1939)-C(5))-methyltransferase RlmD [Clostridiaceae bacterium]|nr:23S rRNA (uracil(1939)-C(5))-methyltransferase RlmD [Clostridiaceae bacterium]